MPTYDYRCTKCGHRFELFHSMSDDSPKRCPKCRSKSVRVPAGGAGLLFKGSGFYLTDYRSKSYKEGAKREKGGGTSGTGDSKGGGAPGAGDSKGGGAPATGDSKGKKKKSDSGD